MTEGLICRCELYIQVLAAPEFVSYLGLFSVLCLWPSVNLICLFGYSICSIRAKLCSGLNFCVRPRRFGIAPLYSSIMFGFGVRHIRLVSLLVYFAEAIAEYPGPAITCASML